MYALDVIVPVRNEEEAISVLVKRIAGALRRVQIAYTIIFVDDVSTDGTIKKIKALQKKYPIKLINKQGKQGKAFSILEGVAEATSDYVVMLDADLEYPPEAIPEMLQVAVAKDYGVVIARRTTYRSSLWRRLASRVNAWVFGRVLLGLPYDVQSGLKLFRRDIMRHIYPKSVRAWAIDLPLLYTAKGLGLRIGEVDIEFTERTSGISKMRFLTTAYDITTSALLLSLAPFPVYHLHPESRESMIGAGLAHRGQRFITHTTLPQRFSAHQRVSLWQQCALVSILGVVMMGMAADWRLTAVVLVAILSAIYFLDVLFNLYLILKSLYFPPEVGFTESQIAKISDKDLPVYSILCPLYREAHILGQFVQAIGQLDWPKDKLDVILLLEADDAATIAAAQEMNLPAHFRILVVPHSLPKTKPKACNYGLSHARGEYIVVYDAEDQPDPEQLKKAYLGFQTLPANVACLQAKLNYHNPHDNLLTRLFTAEYSLWFDVVLTGLQTLETSIPLGGTSNHFRTQELKNLHGWDTFNVTEDCDLGARLFLSGKRTAVIDSTTLEEANSNLKNWIRQRSRWIKGYIQTYFVHMRSPVRFIREHGMHALIFQLVVGGKIAFMLINPLLWAATISYFTLYVVVGPTIESLYPTPVFYMAAISMVFGNFLCIYYYMIGLARRGHWSLMKYVFLVPFYWLAASVAAVMAVWQFIFKPHYWEKTNHGLHLKTNAAEKLQMKFVVTNALSHFTSFVSEQMIRLIKNQKYRGATLYLIATIAANMLNLLSNIYLGRELSLAQFAVFNTIVSLLYIITIPMGALSTSINHKTAYLDAKYSSEEVLAFFVHVRKRAMFLSLILVLIWTAGIPFMSIFFHLPSVWPLLAFTPILTFGLLTYIDQGFLKGKIVFAAIAVATIIEPTVRLVVSILLVESRLKSLVYVSVPLGVFAAYLAARHFLDYQNKPALYRNEFRLSKVFFVASLIAGLSSIAFFKLDNILVAHFLSPQDTGLYGVLGVVGKMIYFVGSLVSAFIIPVISRYEAKGQNSQKVFRTLLLITITMTVMAYMVFGLGMAAYGSIAGGVKLHAISSLLPYYGLGIGFFTISQFFVTFHLAKRENFFPAVAFLLSLVQILGMWKFHDSLNQVIGIMVITGGVSLLAITVFHVWYEDLKVPLQNIRDFIDLFVRLPQQRQTATPRDNCHVLILNWRDTKHRWAGGAEIYLRKIAVNLVKRGFRVTLFCGNDGNCLRSEIIDGVRIIRRGGFMSVYFWACVYYIFHLRQQVDVVIDSENGIPFLTPLYVRKPIILLIHHIHQDVFRQHLRFPLKQIAMFIEAQAMPFLYNRKQIITVSNSSKEDLTGLGLGAEELIEVINPGVDIDSFQPAQKTPHPSICYVGRLKPYKNIDVAIRAFAKLLKYFPTAIFTIAGGGESESELARLVSKLKLTTSVNILGQVSEERKKQILAQNWCMIQPSTIEGWGITVIEANASGTPVVASDVKGLRDSVAHLKTGFLVPAKDVAKFAKAVKKIIDDDELRAQLSEQALTWSKNFSWEVSGRSFTDVIDNISCNHQSLAPAKAGAERA